jgi:hypothetical protein
MREGIGFAVEKIMNEKKFNGYQKTMNTSDIKRLESIVNREMSLLEQVRITRILIGSWEELDSLAKHGDFKNQLAQMRIKKANSYPLMLGLAVFVGMSLTPMSVSALLGIIFIPVSAIFGFVTYKLTKWFANSATRSNNKLINNNDQTIKTALEERETIIRIFNKLKTPVHEKYLYSHALNHFEDYLSTGRATSLRECMNMYENEIRFQHISYEISSLRDEIYNLEDEINRIPRSY